MSPPGDRREPPVDTKCPPAAQRKQAKRACKIFNKEKKAFSNLTFLRSDYWSPGHIIFQKFL